MKSCGNPKAYLSVGIGIILMVLTVYLTVMLSEYLIRVENQQSGKTEYTTNFINAKYVPNIAGVPQYATYWVTQAAQSLGHIDILRSKIDL